jgi:hypothetical protein
MLPPRRRVLTDNDLRHMVRTPRFAYPAAVTVLLDFAESSCLDAGNR